MELCEIHPIRTEFLEALGEGAFGKVHKARLHDSLDFFASNEGFCGRNRQSTKVAVKELHGMSYQRNYVILMFYVCMLWFYLMLNEDYSVEFAIRFENKNPST